ncbi:MAG: MEDS domain-containing protein [Blastococcus sp.]
MRAQGRIPDLTTVQEADHVCWVYDGDASFDVAVRDFLEDGLARGYRLLCVGERVIDGLRGRHAPLQDVETLLAEGSLETLTVAQAYDATGRFCPEQQLEFYGTATRRALADGYRGLRVVADVSPLADQPALLSDLLRWEHLADEYIAHGFGFSAMCAYRRELGAAFLGEAASTHPVVSAPDGLPAFRLFFDDGRLAVAGSVDTSSAGVMSRVLAGSPITGPRATLDLGRIDFLDVAACRALALWARDLRERSIDLEICGASRLVRRMWSVLGLSDIAPVSFVEELA